MIVSDKSYTALLSVLASTIRSILQNHFVCSYSPSATSLRGHRLRHSWTVTRSCSSSAPRSACRRWSAAGCARSSRAATGSTRTPPCPFATSLLGHRLRHHALQCAQWRHRACRSSFGMHILSFYILSDFHCGLFCPTSDTIELAIAVANHRYYSNATGTPTLVVEDVNDCAFPDDLIDAPHGGTSTLGLAGAGSGGNCNMCLRTCACVIFAT